MKFVKSTLLVGLSSIAHSTHVYTAICEAACGIIDAADKDCEAAFQNEDGTCRHLFRNGSGAMVYNAELEVASMNKVTVDEALELVKAPGNDCYAMCYENALCRPKGSRCTPKGVCSKLYWDVLEDGKEKSYSYYSPSTRVSELAPVVCDPSSVEEEPVPAPYSEFVDVCGALCALSKHTEDCSAVYQNGDKCHRLFWATSEKKTTVFMHRIDSGDLQQVMAKEAFDILRVPTCEQACSENPECMASKKSYCREENHTCRSLFYNPGKDLSSKTSCYGSACNELTPMLCLTAVEKEEAFSAKETSEDDSVKTSTKKDKTAKQDDATSKKDGASPKKATAVKTTPAKDESPVTKSTPATETTTTTTTTKNTGLIGKTAATTVLLVAAAVCLL